MPPPLQRGRSGAVRGRGRPPGPGPAGGAPRAAGRVEGGGAPRAAGAERASGEGRAASGVRVERATSAGRLWGSAWAMAEAFHPQWPAVLSFGYAVDRGLNMALASQLGSPGTGAKFLCLSAERRRPRDGGRPARRRAAEPLGAGDGGGRLKRWMGRGIAGACTVDNRSFYFGKAWQGEQASRQWQAYVANVCVVPTARRAGIAKQLMAEAEVVAADWGCEWVFLTSELDNVAALQLYKTLGYRELKETELFAGTTQCTRYKYGNDGRIHRTLESDLTVLCKRVLPGGAVELERVSSLQTLPDSA